MRVNANRKVHQMKRDPFKTLVKIVAFLLVFVIVGIGVFYLCSKAVENDFIQKRNATIQQNEEDEIAFNAQMNEMRAKGESFFESGSGEDAAQELQYWEKSIDGSTWRIEDEGRGAPENTSNIVASRSELMLGGLMLVNAWHPLPAEFSDESLIPVGSTSGYKVPSWCKVY